MHSKGLPDNLGFLLLVSLLTGLKQRFCGNTGTEGKPPGMRGVEILEREDEAVAGEAGSCAEELQLSLCSLQVLPGLWCSKPFVTFHQINAFEERGCVVLDLCCQDEGTSLALYTLQNMRRSGEGLDQVRSLPWHQPGEIPALLPQQLLQQSSGWWNGEHRGDSTTTTP